MVFVLLQITVVTFLPFNLQIADIKQLANTAVVPASRPSPLHQVILNTTVARTVMLSLRPLLIHLLQVVRILLFQKM